MTTESTTETQETKVYLETYNEFMAALNKAVELGLEIDESEPIGYYKGNATIDAKAFGLSKKTEQYGNVIFLLYVYTQRQAEELKERMEASAFFARDEFSMSNDFQPFNLDKLRKYIDIRTAELETPF